jgi:GT2 family glycosyltransferase
MDTALMPAPRVTVAVLQREAFGHTQRSLESLYATAGAPFDLIYFDIGSPPRIKHIIEDEARRRGFQIVRREGFLTPNETRNLALASIATEFIAYTDNDIIFRDGWLERLLACADETGADLVGPLLFMDEPPFRRIHSTGGDAHIEETAAGRRFHESHPFAGDYITDAIATQLVRRPSEMLELHCMLIRRAVFDRIGPFDEGIRSISEHLDLCMVARQHGATLMFEPSAVANHLLPKHLPLDLESLPFFLSRWSRRSNRASFEHYLTKWNLPPDDAASVATHNWSNDRRLIIIRSVRPKIAAHGLRKLRRVARQVYQRLMKRAAPQT